MTDELEAVAEVVAEAPLDAVAVEPEKEPEVEPEVPASVGVLDTVAVVGEGGAPVILPIAPPGAVAAEQRVNDGRVEHFTASGELILK